MIETGICIEGTNMKNLYKSLPSLSPDYSGACGVFFEINGLIVMCDPGACTGNIMALDEARMGPGNDLYSVTIHDSQAVFGFDQDLITKVRLTLNEKKKDFIVLLGTPVSATLAADFKGLAEQLGREFGIPGFGFDTTGIDTYDVGQKKAFDLLVKKIVKDDSDHSIDVNVIGATPLDMWDVNQVNDYLRLLKACGVKKAAVWGRNAGIQQISQAAGAKLNIVVSASAVSAAEKLQKKYGTPYVIGFPIGKEQTRRWKDRLVRLLNGQQDVIENQTSGSSGKRALIVGEQITSNAIRDMLRSEFGYGEVDVASFFHMEAVCSELNDRKLKNEEELIEMSTEKGKYDLVICDPFIYPIFPYQAERRVPYPHTAVSGRTFWTRSANCFGEKGSTYFEEKLGEKSCIN